MAKKICFNCDKKLRIFDLKFCLKDDSYICKKCLNLFGIEDLDSPNRYSQNDVLKFMKESGNLLRNFSPTKEINKYLKIDENNKTFMVGHNIFKFSQLHSFDLLADNNVVSKGGLGRAVAGGLLFGGVGAIVGGVTGSKKSKNICSSLKIKLTISGAHCTTPYITFISSDTKTKSIFYKAAESSAQTCLSELSLIKNYNQINNTEISPADEIMKFKKLLDDGIITQEEFETKKKQLLEL